MEHCKEHGGDTVVLCAKFENDWTTEKDLMDERDLARFKFKVSFGRIFYIAQHSWIYWQNEIMETSVIIEYH